MDWFPAITTTGVFAALLWLCKNLISTRLTKSVEHEFNRKIELLRDQLQARENDIAALRGGALTAMSARQMALDKRRLEAIDEVWAAIVSLAPAKSVSSTMSVINFEVAAGEAATNEKARRLFDVLGSGFDPKGLMTVEAKKARPYVSPMIWSLYSAYSAIVFQAVCKLMVLKSGARSKIVEQVKIAKLVKTVLPHHSSYVDKFGDAGYHELLDEIEERILAEISTMLSSGESDRASLDQAAAILKESNNVIDSLETSKP